MARASGWARLGLLSTGREAPRHGADYSTNVMHVDGDDICPKCLSWVTPTDIVRRTAYGLVQHEACSAGEPSGVGEFSSL